MNSSLDEQIRREMDDILRKVKPRPLWYWPVAVTVTVPFVFLFVVLRAWTLSWLWWWFVVPLGVPMLNVWHTYGLAVLLSFATTPVTALSGIQRDKSKEAQMRQVVAPVLAPPLALGLGFLLHWWMP